MESEVRAWRATDSSAAALHAEGVVNLAEGAQRLDAAIAALERARRAAPRDPALLNDLAVAYLELGSRQEQLRPLLRAVDAAEQAAVLDPTSPAVGFTLALARERLYLLDGAAEAWKRYLTLERDSAWRAEARAHLRTVALSVDTVSWEGVAAAAGRGRSASEGEIRVRVQRSPQKAREFVLFTLLAEWGRAVEAGNRADAERCTTLARQIAGALDSGGGDGSVALAVRSIDAARATPEQLRRLARAHVEFAEGRRLYARAAYDAAAAPLELSERALRELGSPASGWAAFYRGATEVERAHYDAADRIFNRILREAPAQESALLGKTTWALGVSQIRRGRYERANRLYRAAIPFIAQAREQENLGALSYVLSEGLNLEGQTAAGRAEALRGLHLLSPFRQSNFLNNHLSTVAAYARGDSLSHAALAVMDEVLAVARTLGKPDVAAWALSARAHDLESLGRTDAMRDALAEAKRWADSVPEGSGRDRVRADVTLASIQLAPGNPRAERRLLDSAVSTYARLDLGVLLPSALYASARAAQAAGDRPAAREALRRAVAAIERQQKGFEHAELRATFNESVENVFDAVIAAELEDGRPASAFAFLERARVASWPARDRRAASGAARPILPRVARRLPADALFVAYALLPDRLVSWSVSARGWRTHTVPVSRDSVAALAERFGGEADVARPDAEQARARLYELLVRPLGSELAGVRRLVVVPDRELGGIPFAALWDSTTSRYLLQDHAVATLPSAAFFLASAAGVRRIDASAAALVVGNPATDSTLELETLPQAGREAREVAGLYHRRTLLEGARAGRDPVLAALASASVFHFAGHAVFNPEQPELSYLALASRAPEDGGLLHAIQIGQLRLSNLEVVVLSACSTLNPRSSHGGAIAGLAYSFLRAGAPATISTLWDVEDAAASPLVVAFHRRLAAGTPAAEALRQAQLAALGSGRAELRAPAAWAAFIYTGP